MSITRVNFRTFSLPRKKLCTPGLSPTSTLPVSPNHGSSTSRLCRFPILGIAEITSHHLWSSLSGFFHFAWCFQGSCMSRHLSDSIPFHCQIVFHWVVIPLLFIHSSFDGRLALFPVWTTVNNAVNILECRFLCGPWLYFVTLKAVVNKSSF